MQDFFNQPFFNEKFFGNSVLEYTIAVGIFILLGLTFKLFHSILINRLEIFAKKTKTKIDDILLAMLKTIKAPFYLYAAFYFAIQPLSLPEQLKAILHLLFLTFVIYQAITAIAIALDYALKKFVLKEDNEASKAAIETLSLVIKIGLWILGGLLFLSNAGINITSLIAGLGIGGIAIAFALQNILKDIFSSFAIFSDKPFVVGDFIIVGDKMGVVEKIGIKTTRIRALQGEEIIISNQELTTVQVQNFRTMQERRVLFTFSVVYQTPQKKLKRIPEIVKTIINAQKQTRFDRAHFFQFGDFGLLFEVVYYVKTGDYTMYMDIQQGINLAINEQFAKEGIRISHPTQAVYVKKE